MFTRILTAEEITLIDEALKEYASINLDDQMLQKEVESLREKING